MLVLGRKAEDLVLAAPEHESVRLLIEKRLLEIGDGQVRIRTCSRIGWQTAARNREVPGCTASKMFHKSSRRFSTGVPVQATLNFGCIFLIA